MNPVVQITWLREHLNDPELVILDASPGSNVSGLLPEYTEVQIPGARQFDLKKNFSNKAHKMPNMLPSPEQFETECQKLGINTRSSIVIYDNLGVYMSPRVWWMFRAMGHENVTVLDGGLSAWIEAGLPTEPISQKAYKPGDFKANFDSHRVKTAEQIMENIKTQQALVLDARSKGRFNGTSPEPRAELRSGHIPGSLNLPFKEVLDNGYFKSKAELSNIFINLAKTQQPLIFSCGSGITACIIMLAAELVLDNDKAVYDGSWTEWGQLDGYPVDV